MEETSVHGSAIECAERSSVRVGQDGFGAVFGSAPAQAMRPTASLGAATAWPGEDARLSITLNSGATGAPARPSCREVAPFGFTLRIGYSTRSGEYTRSRYLATLAQRNPRVTGCSGSPWILVAHPSSMVIRTPQASGQSCGQAAWTTRFIPRL